MIQREEIQGLVASGYGRQASKCSLMLRFTDAAEAAKWMDGVRGQVAFAHDKSSPSKTNIALTFAGLKLLGLPDSELGQFSRAFAEGMVAPHRQRVLGDLENTTSNPDLWRWGGPENPPIHAVLMLYEVGPDAMAQRLKAVRADYRGVEELIALPSIGLQEQKEHFGFMDGISQPILKGFGRRGPARDQVALGEFVLGHVDESWHYEPHPDSAKNGTYLVFRQLQEDVKQFWDYLRAHSDGDEVLWWAAKIMGRWPDGTPLTLEPGRMPDRPRPTNDFQFSERDRDGSRCPFGSHIRRANPRDSLRKNPDKSIASVNRHRILRRGRPWGPPIDPAVYPPGIEVKPLEGHTAEGEERGIYFICLNASLTRQFEFIQQTWLNNPKFLGLSNETDPVGSGITAPNPGEPSMFTAPGEPVRRRLLETPSFIQTVGGAYFFLPSGSLLARLGKGV